jgi:ditrans,polycis-polyprenyl diphosphate synthase
MDVIDKEPELKLTFFQRMALRILSTGNVPRHIAFIMDGNRRFAKQHNFETVLEGHSRGASKLEEVSRLQSFKYRSFM